MGMSIANVLAVFLLAAAFPAFGADESGELVSMNNWLSLSFGPSSVFGVTAAQYAGGDSRFVFCDRRTGILGEVTTEFSIKPLLTSTLDIEKKILDNNILPTMANHERVIIDSIPGLTVCVRELVLKRNNIYTLTIGRLSPETFLRIVQAIAPDKSIVWTWAEKYDKMTEGRGFIPFDVDSSEHIILEEVIADSLGIAIYDRDKGLLKRYVFKSPAMPAIDPDEINRVEEMALKDLDEGQKDAIAKYKEQNKIRVAKIRATRVAAQAKAEAEVAQTAVDWEVGDLGYVRLMSNGNIFVADRNMERMVMFGESGNKVQSFSGKLLGAGANVIVLFDKALKAIVVRDAGWRLLGKYTLDDVSIRPSAAFIISDCRLAILYEQGCKIVFFQLERGGRKLLDVSR